MNNLMQNIKTMSSREIAQLCEKRHDNVCRDIELINIDYENEGLLKIEDTLYTNAQNGQQYREYVLTQQQCLDLLTGYSRPMRIRVNLRWAELEQKEAQASSPVMPALPHDYISALEELLVTKKGEHAALEQVKELKPKADALDTLSHAKGALGIRETAITVGIPERKFIARCTDENKPVTSRFMYRDDKGKLRAYSHRIKQGFMTQKITSYAGKNGHDLVTVQVKFTAAGIAHIAKMMQNKPVKQLRVM